MCQDYRLQQEFITPYTKEESVCGNTTLRDLRTHDGRSPPGCSGTTRVGCIRLYSIEVHSNIDENKQRRWLEFRRALQFLDVWVCSHVYHLMIRQ